LLFDTVAIVIFIEAHKFNLLLFVVYVELKIRHDDEVIAGIFRREIFIHTVAFFHYFFHQNSIIFLERCVDNNVHTTSKKTSK